MAFYLTSPSLELLICDNENEIKSRLKYLFRIMDDKHFDKMIMEDHIPNTDMDEVSHFFLRLCCQYSVKFNNFFIQSELKAFEKRLEGFDVFHARRMLLILKRQLSYANFGFILSELCNQNVIAMKKICDDILTESFLRHAFQENHDVNCRKIIIKVPFMFCSSLIRNREVLLERGICLVHCGVWKKLLKDNFRAFLLYGLEQDKKFSLQKLVDRDVRLQIMIRNALNFFSKLGNENKRLEKYKLAAAEVDDEAKLFPPCALKLLQDLRSKRKLPHRARIQLTLFLKDVGMDINEAIKFWKDAYSEILCNSNGVGTKNAFSKPKKKESYYVYNIQHLYGLKGSRKNYESSSCSQLQSTGGEHGCPFVNMSGRQLLNILPEYVAPKKRCGDEQLEDIEDLVVKKIVDLGYYQNKPSKACWSCLASHMEGRSKLHLLYKEKGDVTGVVDKELIKSEECSSEVSKERSNSEEAIGEESCITKPNNPSEVIGEIFGRMEHYSKIKGLHGQSDNLASKMEYSISEEFNASSQVDEQEVRFAKPEQYYLILKSMKL